MAEGVPDMATTFSTDDVHPRDRLAYWREVATKGFARHTFRPTDPMNYDGAVRLGFLGELGVADFECDPGEVSRSANEISSSDGDDLLICAQIDGEGDATQDGRRGVVNGGSFCLLDTRRPFRTNIYRRTRSVIVQVPRQKLDVRLGPITSLTAHTMDGQKALPALAAGFLARLPSCLDAVDVVAAAGLAEQALDLLALALSSETGQNVIALSSSRAATLRRLKFEIESRLADPDLRPSTVAEAVGISVRYANALLSAEQTSLERYIVQQRLERCRRALDDPVQELRSIGEIAYGWGFSDLSHFARRFKAAFGVSPSDYRRRSA
jgi:AraC family transcriptional regulator, positive regulator of tynA and feaB